MTILDVALSLSNVILNTTLLGNVGDCSCTVNSTHYNNNKIFIIAHHDIQWHMVKTIIKNKNKINIS